MTVGIMLLAFVGAWNVGRLRPALPVRPTRTRTITALIGTVCTLGAVAALALAADSIADWLDVTPPTVRIAVGVVAAVVGVRDLLSAPPAAEPALPGVGAGIVPLFFPLLFSPVAGLLALSASIDRGVAVTVAVAAGALAVLVVGGLVPASPPATSSARVERGVQRVLAVVLVLAAVALVVDGIYDI